MCSAIFLRITDIGTTSVARRRASPAAERQLGARRRAATGAEAADVGTAVVDEAEDVLLGDAAADARSLDLRRCRRCAPSQCGEPAAMTSVGVSSPASGAAGAAGASGARCRCSRCYAVLAFVGRRAGARRGDASAPGVPVASAFSDFAPFAPVGTRALDAPVHLCT